MDAASGTERNGSIPLPTASQPARKEWRVVSEQSVRNSGNEGLERLKLGQSDERLIYEVQHGREPVDVDFCSITMDGGSDNDILQQRLHAVAKQREELQHMEVELRAQVIVRSEFVVMQSALDAQIKEHANANIKLQEQLREKEQQIHELERKMDEKERELHTTRLDREAAWAKEDLLREQSKELQSYMRERDNSEAERVQHIKQIHDLQEHIQDKERQFMELQEQHRIAQETVVFKDKQIREAQAWITRAQEMDALQSTTNHTLQAELRERTEQYNQLWLGCQRQFGEMERLHVHIHQLQLELADVKGGSYLDGSRISQTNSKDATQLGQSNGSQLDVNGNNSPQDNSSSIQNGNSESAASFASGGSTSMQKTDNVHGVGFAPASLLVPTYLPTAQVTALHPYVMHQQSVPHPSHATQSQYHSVPATSHIQDWQNQQARPDGQHAPIQDQYPQQTEQNLSRTYEYEASVDGQARHAIFLDNNVSQGVNSVDVVPPPKEEVLESVDKSYSNSQSQQSLQEISSQFHDALRLDHQPRGHDNDPEENKVNPISDQEQEIKNMKMEDSDISVNSSSPEVPVPAKHINVGNSGDSYLLDERALLASIARTIGSGGRIRVSSTLPNRLGKMLAPLHWHDYKKKYGKLDDFVAGHPELFLIEGDHIQLREGAQEVIAAKAAAAKVAAAAAEPNSYSSLLPSVAVTPMAQSHRLRKNQSLSGNVTNVAGGVSNVKILSKHSDPVDRNGSDPSAGRSSLMRVANGTYSDKPDFSQSIEASHRMAGVNLAGKQQGRTIGAAKSHRR